MCPLRPHTRATCGGAGALETELFGAAKDRGERVRARVAKARDALASAVAAANVNGGPESDGGDKGPDDVLGASASALRRHRRALDVAPRGAAKTPRRQPRGASERERSGAWISR